MHITDKLRAVLRDQMDAKAKWMYRALLMATVLKSLGYSVDSIMNGGKDVLAGYVYREADEIIRCLQMKGG